MVELWILLLFILVLWTLFNCLSMPLLKDSSSEHSELVSILIPMRNEEANVERLMKSLQKLTYSHIEVVVLNDGSTDNTGNLLEQAKDQWDQLTVINGKELPEGWVGKVHACHQLSLQANGDFYLFLDADVTVHPKLVERSLAAFTPQTGLISGFPHYPLKSVFGFMLIPMQHFLVFFHLPILLANKTNWQAATAAHGAFMMYRREAYIKMGGHERVKDSLVEDIHSMRAMKQSGYKATIVNNTNSLSCFMYNTSKEVWQGFSKNFFPGLGRSVLVVIALSFLYLILFFLPLPVAIIGLIQGNLMLVVPLLLVMLIKCIIDSFTRQKWWLCTFFPVTIIATIAMLLYSTYLGISKRGFIWKGRQYR
ncbi:glycosyltransferase [Paenalkalicoccus suaedae]|uniref:4,4'-diaponeurosporenoate glycosyltransferase n=1 Tax=Paenalkalicoccus suaedae TaxID=2592382 RepID=A0A859FDP8_9BACI|nr:glycosyltransferase family 2 protein [Paenalkalicoccus suaedae]QKS71010.1 glycosyltransferase [Paenalkalicoccus suaedae]